MSTGCTQPPKVPIETRHFPGRVKWSVRGSEGRGVARLCPRPARGEEGRARVADEPVEAGVGVVEEDPGELLAVGPFEMLGDRGTVGPPSALAIFPLPDDDRVAPTILGQRWRLPLADVHPPPGSRLSAPCASRSLLSRIPGSPVLGVPQTTYSDRRIHSFPSFRTHYLPLLRPPSPSSCTSSSSSSCSTATTSTTSFVATAAAQPPPAPPPPPPPPLLNSSYSSCSSSSSSWSSLIVTPYAIRANLLGSAGRARAAGSWEHFLLSHAALSLSPCPSISFRASPARHPAAAAAAAAPFSDAPRRVRRNPSLGPLPPRAYAPPTPGGRTTEVSTCPPRSRTDAPARARARRSDLLSITGKSGARRRLSRPAYFPTSFPIFMLFLASSATIRSLRYAALSFPAQKSTDVLLSRTRTCIHYFIHYH
jgi:hypothetical protein